MTDAQLIAIAREWHPTNPTAVFRAIIDMPKSDLARAFKARLKSNQGASHGKET